LRLGIDPKEHRKAQRASQAVAEAKAMPSFDECRDAHIASHAQAWKSEVHRKQWISTLETYATPVFGHLPVDAIDTGLVLKAVEPILITRPETASRLRGRIEAILNSAKARGYRNGPNPAMLKGHLDQLLPAKSKVAKVEHHPALPYARVPEFMHDLFRRDGTAARALRFVVLNASRVGEVFGMRWGEVDLTAKLWSIPSERMKGGRPHRVPLSEQALSVLGEAIGDATLSERRLAPDRYVFPGNKPGRPLSNMAMLELIRRMNCEREVAGLPRWTDAEGKDIVPHGFRSSFKDWATDWSPSPAEIVEAAKRGELVEAFPRDLVEVALAHALDSKAEEAYRRTEMIEKRRRLMSKWADWCSRPAMGGDVVPWPDLTACGGTPMSRGKPGSHKATSPGP
jgi:integrase